MDFRERLRDKEEQLRLAQDGHQVRIWTALPCLITSYNSTAMTVECNPAIQGITTNPDGTEQFVNLPTLVDVPVCFPRGGTYTLTFPIAPGDECLVVFSSRCIDGWWQSGQIAPPTEERMHDLSDGFAIVGPFSQAKKLGNVSTTTAQLRSNDGTMFVELNRQGGIVTLRAPTQIIFDAPTVHMTGKVTSVGDMIAGTISLEHHVQSNGGGTGNSGPPVP